jgi:hypothetical protein
LKLIIGKYEGTIYPEDNGYTGAIDLGTNGKGDRNRLKRKGRTKEIVKDKLRKAVAELEAGIETSDSTTVENTVRDWLARGTKGLSAKTINDYKSLAKSNLIPFIGACKLKELTADNVDDWLEARRDHLTTRTLQAIHSILRRSIRRAQARDKVIRLALGPQGRRHKDREVPPYPRDPRRRRQGAQGTPRRAGQAEAHGRQGVASQRPGLRD